MKKKADVTYKIELTFGSKWQRELNEPTWESIINMLASRMEGLHKQNVAVVKKTTNTPPISSS